jgi:hypothetical protein
MMMKRFIVFAAFILVTVAAEAQSPLTFGAYRPFRQATDTSYLQKKWFLTKYVGLSTNFLVGGGSFLSAPVGVQINRELNKNTFAFAGVSAAPTYFHINNLFYQPVAAGKDGFMNVNNVNVNTSAYMGLMYMNDERTFSISGSIGISRRNYHPYAPYYMPVGAF